MNALRESSMLQLCQSLLTIPLSLVLLWGCTVQQNNSEDTRNEIVVLAANAEVLVGENRFSFALLEQDGQTIDNAIVSAQFVKTNPKTLPTPEANSDATRVKAKFRQIKGVTPHIHPDDSLHLHDETHGFYVIIVIRHVRFFQIGPKSYSFTKTFPLKHILTHAVSATLIKFCYTIGLNFRL